MAGSKKQRSSVSKRPSAAKREALVLTERDESARSPRNWSAVTHRLVDPSWKQIEAAILRLDGRAFTDVMLSHGEGPRRVSLSVSGGLNGRVLCSVARPDDPSWDQEFSWLSAPGEGDQPSPQVCGGQAAEYPAWMNVERTLALRAVRYFVTKHSEDPSLEWRRQ